MEVSEENAIQLYKKRILYPAAKFGKLSVKVWGCASSKVVGELSFFNDVITKEYCIDI